MTTPLRRLFPYALRYRRQFLLGLGCVLVTTTFQLLGPWVLKYAIDDLGTELTRSRLAFYAMALLGLAIVGGVFRFLMRRVIVGASRGIEYDLRNDFYAQLQRLPLSYFQAQRTGDLMSRATNDLNAVRMMIGPAVMYAASTLLVFAIAIGLMLSIDARLTLIALIPLPFVTVAVRYFGGAIHRRFEEIQERLAELSAVVQEALSGVRVVRAYRQEASEVARFRRANQEYLERNRLLIHLQGLFFPTMALFLGIGSLLVLWLGSRAVISGRITVGEFVAFNAYLTMLAWPMIAFGWVTNLLQRGMASWKRMLEVLDVVPEIQDPASPAVPADALVTGGIEFRNLTFAYDEQPVLFDISLTIAPGQRVALVGPTGSGKSTLISLLPRLFDPPPGTVFLDGVDVREMPLARLRGAIGMVTQEPFLFSDTIAGNIAFARRREFTDGAEVAESVRAAAAIARLDLDVELFPKGYDTTVGERGITLSGGQKQRTALARALLGDPRILVLDDALSSVDTYTEEAILAGLGGVFAQRTSIIVSHRISTVRDADLIIVLDAGRIVERGRHDELVALGGIYAGLHQQQLLEDELESA